MTTDKLREEIGLQVEINDKWTDDYVLALENKCIKLTEQLEAINYTRCCKSDSELLSCPNTSCPIIRYDNGESYCTKCDYTD